MNVTVTVDGNMKPLLCVHCDRPLQWFPEPHATYVCENHGPTNEGHVYAYPEKPDPTEVTYG